MTLTDFHYWIFDMDGTLTLPVHDFEAIRMALRLPAGVPILEAIAMMPQKRAVEVENKLYEMEIEIAHRATPQPGVFTLLDRLLKGGKTLGIVTRNDENIAHATLKAAGLSGYFKPECLIGRRTCAAKPKPDGILHLLDLWGAKMTDSVMVGDYLFDLQAGFAAGVSTVHFDHSGEYPWHDYTNFGVRSLEELSNLI